MKSTGKAFLRAMIPETWRRAWRRRYGWRWFRGDYSRWEDALADSRGYDDPAGLERVIAAARTVRRTEGSWDRDGEVFRSPTYHLPLLNALQAVAREQSHLKVVDFGGGLGSTWWQHRQALVTCPVRWRVVEQAALVAAGQREFKDEALSFHETLSDAVREEQPDVVLLSSVLPYVAQPHFVLDEVIGIRADHIILDRTPFISGSDDRLVVQHTPPNLGGGSYPCWLFARAPLLDALARDYELLNEWPVAFDDVDATVTYRGMHFRRRGRRTADAK